VWKRKRKGKHHSLHPRKRGETQHQDKLAFRSKKKRANLTSPRKGKKGKKKSSSHLKKFKKDLSHKKKKKKVPDRKTQKNPPSLKEGDTPALAKKRCSGPFVGGKGGSCRGKKRDPGKKDRRGAGGEGKKKDAPPPHPSGKSSPLLFRLAKRPQKKKEIPPGSTKERKERRPANGKKRKGKERTTETTPARITKQPCGYPLSRNQGGERKTNKRRPTQHIPPISSFLVVDPYFYPGKREGLLRPKKKGGKSRRTSRITERVPRGKNKNQRTGQTSKKGVFFLLIHRKQKEGAFHKEKKKKFLPWGGNSLLSTEGRLGQRRAQKSSAPPAQRGEVLPHPPRR